MECRDIAEEKLRSASVPNEQKNKANRIHGDSSIHFTPNLPQASQLL